MRPLFELGATWAHLSAFEDNGAGGAGLDVQAQREPCTTIRLAVGLDLLGKDGKGLRLVCTGQFGSNTRTNAISLNLSIPFCTGAGGGSHFPAWAVSSEAG